MFGVLKKKLSKAIKSISKKIEKKEKKAKEVEKEIEEKIEKEIEEKIEQIVEKPAVEAPVVEKPIIEEKPVIEKPVVEKPKPPAEKPVPKPAVEKPEPVIEKPEPVLEKPKAVEEEIAEKIEAVVEEIKEPEVEIKPVAEELKEEIKEETKKIAKEIKKIEKVKEKPAEKKKKKKSLIKKLVSRVTKKIVEKRLTEAELTPVLDELEIDLIEADVAVEVAEKIKADLSKELTGKEIKRGKEQDAIVGAFKSSLIDILSVPEIDLKKLAAQKKPVVLLFLGFNGSGKTTSIAKVANWLKGQGMTCVLAAADTFRAASLEQLEEHANKIGVKMIKHKYGADPAAVVYDAIEHAKARSINFVLADTAGRVHTNQDLMKEMEKIIRVNKPDLKILVIDSLTGNDAVLQARAFGSLGVDATIFTKVDVNEKGGAILSVTNELKKPILFLGIGQEYKDFEKFDAQKFVDRVLD